MVDASSAPIWFNILIYIQIVFKTYWYAAFPAIGVGMYFLLVRLFAFPLLTRNPCELILIFGPHKVKVLKVTSKVLPYFTFNNNLYWFEEPIQVGTNFLHIYIAGINQPITHLKRNQEKEANVLSLREYTKQTTSHNIIIPPSRNSFIRNWLLVIRNNGGEPDVTLATTEEAGLENVKQRYKIGLLQRLGLYMLDAQEVEGENASGSANQELTTVTIQYIKQKIGDVVRGTNFSSRYAYKIIKRARYVESNWTRLLLGDFDWRILMVVVIIIAVVGIIYFITTGLTDPSKLGPPPAGIPTGP